MGILDKINKHEGMYIIYAGLFAFIYFTLIVPWAIKLFDFKNSFAQFLLLNLGIMAVLMIFIKSSATKSKLPSIRGVLGILCLITAIGVWTPPLSVLVNGNIATATSTSPQFILAASDSIGGLLWTSLGVHGGFTLLGQFIGWIYILTYTVFPILLLLISGFLLKDFVRNI